MKYVAITMMCGSRNVVLKEAIWVKPGLSGPIGLGHDVICQCWVRSVWFTGFAIIRASISSVGSRQVSVSQFGAIESVGWGSNWFSCDLCQVSVSQYGFTELVQYASTSLSWNGWVSGPLSENLHVMMFLKGSPNEGAIAFPWSRGSMHFWKEVFFCNSKIARNFKSAYFVQAFGKAARLFLS